MQEAGIRNFVQESVLSCINGAFAQRWYDVAVANGKQADKLEVEMGEAITPDLLRDALKKKHYEAVTIVHNETSTGVENPLADLCKVCAGDQPGYAHPGGRGFLPGRRQDRNGCVGLGLSCSPPHRNAWHFRLVCPWLLPLTAP